MNDTERKAYGQHIWQPTGSYYSCERCGDPYRGHEDGCAGKPPSREGVFALIRRNPVECGAIAAIVAASYAWALLGYPGVWDAMKGCLPC